jgi:hypothetical protein
VKTGLGDDVNLDSGVTTRVVDGAGVDLGDGHCDELYVWSQRKRGKIQKQESSTNIIKGGRQTVAGSGLAGRGRLFTDGPKRVTASR